ncbi:MAG: ParB/RepB/Spo0J family partition protein [Bacillota bacterium]|nr:ParB/RepB/Spo0J family partition protein [Bacillota bacterium]
MANKKPALGKGLSALIPDKPVYDAAQEKERVLQVAVTALIANPQQPRQSFDEDKLQELKASIIQYGVMQPLIVTEDASGQAEYMIVAGERRFRAAQLAGLEKVPCIVRELDQKQLAELSLIENIQREDLRDLEEAEAYQQLIAEHGYTQEALAERLGKSRPYIANTLRLLKLHPQEKKLLNDGELSAGHARALLSLGDESARGRLLAAIVRERLSVRQSEALAKRLAEEKAPAPAKKPKAAQDAVLADIAKRIGSKHGVKAAINGGAERGRLSLEYYSAGDLQRLIEALLPDYK